MRVALVRLQDNEATVGKLEKWTIPEPVKTGTATEFFAWIAGRIVNLTLQCELDEGETEWKLGLCWSFPFASDPPFFPALPPHRQVRTVLIRIRQNAVNKGTIHQMGKGFNIPSTVNASLDTLLHDALESLRPPHPIRITALLNDAVATLLSHAFIRPTTRMGLICGTGTNATCLCPVEYLSEEKYHHKTGNRAWEQFVLVNTEWSMFGRGVLPVTEYDRIVDRESGMPGFQPFEMMVSGRYIGEIVRLICMDGMKRGVWSFTFVPQGWDTNWAVHTKTCSMVERYPPTLPSTSLRLLMTGMNATRKPSLPFSTQLTLSPRAPTPLSTQTSSKPSAPQCQPVPHPSSPPQQSPSSKSTTNSPNPKQPAPGTPPPAALPPPLIRASAAWTTTCTVGRVAARSSLSRETHDAAVSLVPLH